MRGGSALSHIMAAASSSGAWAVRAGAVAAEHGAAAVATSKERRWDTNTRDAVLPKRFKLAGLMPFDNWRGGAAELVPWILSGDLNVGENTIHNEMKIPASQR